MATLPDDKAKHSFLKNQYAQRSKHEPGSARRFTRREACDTFFPKWIQ